MAMTFKVGDRVRIKSWEQMEKEFGLIDPNCINIKAGFTRGMGHLCGRTATIIKSYIERYVELSDWSDTSGYMDWSFSEDMLELVVEFKEGERVLVRDAKYQDRKERIYLCTIPGKTARKHLCVDAVYEEEYKSGKEFDWTGRTQIKKLETPQEDILIKDGKKYKVQILEEIE